MRHRRKARKQAAQARAKVDAAKLVQRVVRGHWARREYAVRVAEREETRPQMDASNVLKASALRWLYQAAYQAAMVELARQAQRLALGELREGEALLARAHGAHELHSVALLALEGERHELRRALGQKVSY